MKSNDNTSVQIASWTITYFFPFSVNSINCNCHFIRLKYQTYIFNSWRRRICVIIGPRNWRKEPSKIMDASPAVPFSFCVHSFCSSCQRHCFPTPLSTSPQATPSSLNLAFPIIKFPSPEMKLPVRGLWRGGTHIYTHTFHLHQLCETSLVAVRIICRM